jgi:hypothetical protein
MTRMRARFGATVLALALSMGCAPSPPGEAAPGPALSQDSTQAEMLRLLTTSPVLEQRRSLPAEVAFVRDVRALAARTPEWGAAAGRIETAEQAMAALEGLLASRSARIQVTHPTRGFTVQYRRWLYRDDPAVLWTPLQADTTVLVPAAAYQFRYRVAGTDRDTIVTLPCANGCRVPPAP